MSVQNTTRRRQLSEADIAMLLAVDATTDGWRGRAPAALASLTSRGYLSCGTMLTNAGRRALGLPEVPGWNPNAKGVPQYAR